MAEVVATLRGLTVTDEDLKTAKKVVMLDMSESRLSAEGVVEAIGSQIMYGLDADSSATMDLLSTVSVADVQVNSYRIFLKF